MPNFTDALEGAVRSATCGALSANEAIQGWWARNTSLPFTGTLAAGATAARRALCDNPTPVPEQPNDLNNRGQCPDTFYDFTYNFKRFDEDGNIIFDDTVTQRVQGPIVGTSFVDGTAYFIGWTVSPNPGPLDRIVNAYFPGSGQSATKTVINVVPVQGPDDCGTDSTNEPATPIFLAPTNIDVTYIDNTNTEITEQGDFNLSLPIFLPGSIVIPFNVDFGGVQIDGRIDINGDITFEINPGRQPDDTVTDTEPPQLPPGQEPVEPETERRIIGVHVFTTLPPNSPVTTIFQEDGPNIFAPRGGSVRFLVSGGGGSSWTRDIDIKGDRQYIPCPAQQGAISVIANELPGGTVSLIRVYGSIPSYLIPGV